MDNFDFPCSRTFRRLEAEQDLDPCLTQKEKDFELWLVATGGPLNEREYEALMGRKAFRENQTRTKYFRDQVSVKDALIDIITAPKTKGALPQDKPEYQNELPF